MERDISSQNVPYQPDLKGELTLIDQSRLLSLAPQNSAAMSQEIDTTLTNESPGCRSSSGLNNTHVIQTLIEQNKILTEKVNDVWNQQASLSVRGMMTQSFSGRAGISSGGFTMGLSGDCCYSCSEKERQIEELTRTLGKTESEMTNLQAAMSHWKRESQMQINEDQRNLEDLKSSLLTSEAAIQELADRNRKLSKENEKMIAYKATLPTKSEFLKLKHELETERNKKEQLKDKLSSASEHLQSSRAVAKANQASILERNKEIEDLKVDLAKSSENVKLLENFIRADQSGNDETATEMPHIVIDNLRREAANLSAELTKFKKLAKTQRSNLKSEVSKRETEAVTYKSQIEALTGRNEELATELKELQLEYKLLKTSFEEVSQDNVFLQQENESVSAENQQLKNLELSEKYKKNKSITKQLEQCHKQMREVFLILDKIKSEKEVDISLLLGEPADNQFENEVVASQVPIGDRVNQLLKDVKRFRDDINERAASNMASQSDCRVQ